MALASRIAWQRGLALPIVVTAFIALSSLYGFIIPFYEAPDEHGHIAKINYIYTNRQIPNLNIEFVPIGSQPPLYHAIAAGLLYAAGSGTIDIAPIWIGIDSARKTVLAHSQAERDFSSRDVQAFHLLRVFSTALGAATVVVTYKTAKLVFRNHARLALLAAGVNAFIPQFTFISGVINYDAMVSLFSAISIYFVIKSLDSPNLAKIDSLSSGVAGAAAMLTKYNAVFIAFLTLGSFGVRRLRSKTEGNSKLLANAAIFAAALLLLSGWFYARNQILYGNPLGWGLANALKGWEGYSPAPGGYEPKSLISPYFTSGFFFLALFVSFWFNFGWMNIPAPIPVYLVFAVFSFLAVVGIFRSMRAVYKSDMERFTLLTTMLAAFLMVFAGVVYYNLWYTQPQGRFMFPAISVISILLVEGLRAIGNRLFKNQILLPAALVLSLHLINAGGLVYLSQIYG